MLKLRGNGWRWTSSLNCRFKSGCGGKIFESQAPALPCGGDNRLIKPFLARLGFKLTGAQTKVLREIRADMGGAHPMRRLLQGDVVRAKPPWPPARR